MKNLTEQNTAKDRFYCQMESPLGILTLIASDTLLSSISWQEQTEEAAFKAHLKNLAYAPENPVLKNASLQLAEYFEGKRTAFTIPFNTHGTSFQRQAWQALTTIPYGETISYKEQATKIGDAKKARAIGLANGKNPLPIVIPCHRVIGSNGKLTGFTGGLDKKIYLLQLEKGL